MRKSFCLKLFAFAIILSLAAASTLQSQSARNGQTKNDWFSALIGADLGFNEEMKCYICTIVISAMEKYAYANQINLDDFIMNHFCKLFPITVRKTCDAIIAQYGPSIIQALTKSTSPDQVCREIKVCNLTECNLFPKGSIPPLTFSADWKKYADRVPPQSGVSALDWIRDILSRLRNGHLPLVDVDGDKNAAEEAELRGYNWRGRDCNDYDPAIHPGRKTDPYPGLNEDFNCNGISGKDNVTGQAYKTLFCNNSQQLGVVVMGDSAGAHAEIPAEWMNGTAWSESVFANILNRALDEVDLPHMSGYTEYEESGSTLR